MKRTATAMLMPPVAVVQYGAAGATAAPIGVFWCFALLSVCYGMLGGIFSESGISWIEVLLGIALWLISGVWAKLVIQGVQHDAQHLEDSTLDNTIEPSPEEPDPLEETQPH